MINEEDKNLFRSAVANILPKDKDGKYQTHSIKKQAAFTAYSKITEANLSGSDVINYAKYNVSPKILKKMKSGNIDSVPVLDLHGQNVIEACESMSQFIYYHQNQQFVQIIHGKGYHSQRGMSLLKTQVVHFLKQHPGVVAFNSCPSKDGGTGAVFALLKQN